MSYSKKFREAHKKIEEERIAQQLNCEHKKVFEVLPLENVKLTTLNTFRVCHDCGFAEANWSEKKGYQILTDNNHIEKIDKRSGYSYVVGSIHYIMNANDFESAVKRSFSAVRTNIDFSNQQS